MSGSVARTLDILEVVAGSGGATAKEIAEATELPLPTVYRLIRDLLDGDYLVHIRPSQRFELGYKLHALGVSLHEQVGVSQAIRAEVFALHHQLNLAAYLALHRGCQIVVVVTADAPQCPRLPPLEIGYHEAAHATAFGKILLANLDQRDRLEQLDEEPMPRFGPCTITSHRELFDQLDQVAGRGIAWESGEFSPGMACAAAPVRSRSGALLGSVAVSAPDARITNQRSEVERALRSSAARIGRLFRVAS